MIRFFLLHLFFLFSSISYSQVEIRTYIDSSVVFVFDLAQNDKCTQKLINAWGEPEIYSTDNLREIFIDGYLFWENIAISGIDSSFNVQLIYRVKVPAGASGFESRILPFNDQLDKIQNPTKLESDEYILTQLIFKDKFNNYLRLDDALVTKLKSYLVLLIND